MTCLFDKGKNSRFVIIHSRGPRPEETKIISKAKNVEKLTISGISALGLGRNRSKKVNTNHT